MHIRTDVAPGECQTDGYMSCRAAARVPAHTGLCGVRMTVSRARVALGRSVGRQGRQGRPAKETRAAPPGMRRGASRPAIEKVRTGDTEDVIVYNVTTETLRRARRQGRE